MRLRLPFGRRALLAAGLAVALVATCPARLVLAALDLDAVGLAAREVRGTIWAASASEAQLAGMPLDDVRLALDPLPLLAGHARLVAGGEGDARASVTVARHAFGFRAADWRLAAGTRFAPLPLAGVVLEDMHARFRDGLCDAAGGRMRLELGGDPYGVGLPATLAGPVRCEAGALMFEAAAGAAQVRLRMRGGTVHAALTLSPADAATATKLAAAGFARAADGSYRLEIDAR